MLRLPVPQNPEPRMPPPHPRLPECCLDSSFVGELPECGGESEEWVELWPGVAVSRREERESGRPPKERELEEELGVILRLLVLLLVLLREGAVEEEGAGERKISWLREMALIPVRALSTARLAAVSSAGSSARSPAAAAAAVAASLSALPSSGCGVGVWVGQWEACSATASSCWGASGRILRQLLGRAVEGGVRLPRAKAPGNTGQYRANHSQQSPC